MKTIHVTVSGMVFGNANYITGAYYLADGGYSRKGK